ncbi:MAG: T9SS type A sorting domain-containing protein [Bacteroidales bacterium]
MKRIVIILSLISIFCFSNVFSQTWSNVGGGVIYKFAPNGTSVSAMATDTINNVLYVGGQFDSAGTVFGCYGVAKWNGVSWDSLGAGTGAYSLIIYNSQLYAGGNNVTKWNGTSWDDVGTGVIWNGGIHSLCAYNGELYAGGFFDSAGTVPANHIAKWNGSVWEAVGSGVNGNIFNLCAYNGELYAGGNFDSAGTIAVNHIARWDGANWSSVGSGTNSEIYSLCVYNGELYAGGSFTQAGGNTANYIAKWNGTSWNSIPSAINSLVANLQVFNNNLILIGVFASPGQGIAQCNGSSISSLANSYIAGGSLAENSAMAVYNGALYVGGYHLIGAGISPDYITCHYIASYSIATAVNPHQIHSIEFSIYPNPANDNVIIENASINRNNEIFIYSIQGELLLKLQMLKAKTDIDISSLAKGIYFLKVSTEKGMETIKFVKV